MNYFDDECEVSCGSDDERAAFIETQSDRDFIAPSDTDSDDEMFHHQLHQQLQEKRVSLAVGRRRPQKAGPDEENRDKSRHSARSRLQVQSPSKGSLDGWLSSNRNADMSLPTSSNRNTTSSNRNTTFSNRNTTMDAGFHISSSDDDCESSPKYQSRGSRKRRNAGTGTESGFIAMSKKRKFDDDTPPETTLCCVYKDCSSERHLRHRYCLFHRKLIRKLCFRPGCQSLRLGDAMYCGGTVCTECL